MSNIGIRPRFADQILEELKQLQTQLPSQKAEDTTQTPKRSALSFLDHLKEGVVEVNEMQKTSDQMATDLASGKTQNLHETMLAATQAELGFNFMVQVRNKVIEAYQEVMRMQV